MTWWCSRGSIIWETPSRTTIPRKQQPIYVITQTRKKKSGWWNYGRMRSKSLALLRSLETWSSSKSNRICSLVSLCKCSTQSVLALKNQKQLIFQDRALNNRHWWWKLINQEIRFNSLNSIVAYNSLSKTNIANSHLITTIDPKLSGLTSQEIPKWMLTKWSIYSLSQRWPKLFKTIWQEVNS